MEPLFHIQSDSLGCSFSSTKAGRKVYFSESKVVFEKCDLKRCSLYEADSDEGRSRGSRLHPKGHFLHD